MPLGYKYAERDATSEVDWSTIGKDITDMLTAQRKVREEKKAAIDQATREYGKKLAEAPQGEHVGMNQWALNYANDAQKARLLQDRLLKSGHLDLKDYLVQRQNLTDGTDQLFGLTQEYQDEYAKKMEAWKNGEIQSLTIDNMKDVEGFSNFTETKAYINPTDYSLNVAKMVKNPETGVMEMSQNPNEFTTVNSLRNRIKSTYAKYDLEGNVKEYVGGLGEKIDAVAALGSTYKTGTITSTLDVMKMKDLPAYTNFEKAETAALESRLRTPYDYSSVLTENIKTAPNGKSYDFTWSDEEAKKNPNLILKKIDANSGNITVDLSDKQKKDVIEHMRVQARMMYDEKKTIQETDQFRKDYLPEYLYTAGKEKEQKKEFAKSLAQNTVNALFGDQDAASQGAGGFSTTTGLGFDKVGNSVKIYGYNDNGQPDLGRVINVSLSDKNQQNLNRFLSAIAERKGIDKDTFIKEFNAYKNSAYKNKGYNPHSVKGFYNERPNTQGEQTPATGATPTGGGASKFNQNQEQKNNQFLNEQGMSGG
jgi:hypothetical protein